MINIFRGLNVDGKKCTEDKYDYATTTFLTARV